MEEEEKIKVMFVLPKLTPGGTERAVSLLANYFSSKENYEVSILLMFKKDLFFKLNENIKIIEPTDFRGKFGKVFFIPLLLNYLRSNIRQIKPTYIFSFGYILITLISSVFIRTKVIVSYRSSPDRVRFPNNKLLNGIYNLLNSIFKFRVDGLIAQTNYALEVYGKRYPRIPQALIPNFLREIKSYKGERKNEIITMGRCDYEKSQKDLIEAFAKINPEDWNLVILGDGPLRPQLEKQAKDLGVAAKVKFLGFHQDVDKFLSTAKIFAFTSILEGFPNAIIEAMANQLPVVSYNCVAGPSDIIQDGYNGFLIEVSNINELVQRLTDLIKDEALREKMGHHSKLLSSNYEYYDVCAKYELFMLSVK